MQVDSSAFPTHKLSPTLLWWGIGSIRFIIKQSHCMFYTRQDCYFLSQKYWEWMVMLQKLIVKVKDKQ